MADRKDRKRKKWGAEEWALLALGLLGGATALLIAEDIRRENERRRNSAPCPNCNQAVVFPADVCPHCGAELIWESGEPMGQPFGSP